MRAEQRRRELAKEERQRIEEHRRRGAEELERLRLLKLKCGSLLASSLMSKGTTDEGPTCLCGCPLASCSMAGGTTDEAVPSLCSPGAEERACSLVQHLTAQARLAWCGVSALCCLQPGPAHSPGTRGVVSCDKLPILQA